MCNLASLFRIKSGAKTREAGNSTVTEIIATPLSYAKDSAEVDIGLTFWGKRGETAERILSQGDIVFAYGELRFRTYKGTTSMSLQVTDYKKVSSGDAEEAAAASELKKTLATTPVAVDASLDDEIPF